MSETEFLARLNSEFLQSLLNDFGKENFDQDRFGLYPKPTWRERRRRGARRNAISRIELENARHSYEHLTSRYGDDLDFIYRRLDEPSRHLLVKLVAYRALGYRRVWLPRNDATYWEALQTAKGLKDPHDTIDPKFQHFVLEKFDLRPLGYDIALYFTDLGIAIDFILEQYAYKRGGEAIVEAAEGDIAIDCGGCWGDTALYLAHKVGSEGRVFTFEFIPGNVDILKRNLDLNPRLRERIKLIENPVWETSGDTIYFRDFGPGSAVSLAPLAEQTGTTTTVSIDDLVEREKLPRVDFIKMDIEGAEPSALRGALATIKKHRPKLAIAIYHSMDDFVNIPKWLMGLDLNYRFYLGHYTIHAEETVLFAAPY